MAKASLTILNSKPDIYGNRYWGFIYYDLPTGKTVYGKTTGGDSNIYAILNGWDGVDGWNRSVAVYREELPIRAFNKRVRPWEYAGCDPDEIKNFIIEKLKG